MIERTAEEWGRLAVSIPGFTWTMPWASLPDEHGRVWRRNWCPRDSGFGWTQVCGLTDKGPRPTFEAIDPDDPATAGCLLALLSSLGVDITMPGRGSLAWRVIVCHGPVNYREGATLGRAVIAAAEALGYWPAVEVSDD